MDKILFPWQSHVMREFPWAMPLFMAVMALLLSMISWTRRNKE